MASATLFRTDQRVIIAGKGIGTIAFVGKTEFADGEWIGVILDEPKGKNNGTVQKKDGTTVRYFTCNDNHGLYVRAAQIESVINDLQPNLSRSASNQSIKSQGSSTGSIPAPTSTGVPRSSGLPTKQSGLRAPSSAKAPELNDDKDQEGLTRAAQSSNDISASGMNERISPPKDEVESKQVEASKTTTSMPPPSIIPPIDSNVASRKSVGSAADSMENQQLILSLKSKISDQEEQIQTLIKKRRDDLEKVKEFERTKIQLDQLQSYKREAQERMKELNEKLQQHENELKETKEKFGAYRDEMSDTEVRIESLTLDLEMAEEKLETANEENTQLKEKLEEVQLELDVIKGEIQLNGIEHVANSVQQKIDDEKLLKMQDALIKLRDLSLAKQAENETLKKENETLETKIKSLTKECEHAKTDISNMQATIADLKEQVDTCLGAQQMVDILTTKNLTLEDQVRELQEAVDNLESLCEMDKEMEENAKEIERELRENIDLLQNQIREKERQVEQLQYNIGDHERTILKFRETVKSMQTQSDQQRRQIERYEDQLKLAGSAQSSEFKAKIVETKTYAEIIEHQLNKVEVEQANRHIQLLTLFLPEQFLKRGADHDCIHVLLLIHRLVAKCEFLKHEIEKKSERLDKVQVDDVLKSDRAEQWSFVCKLSQTISMFRLILRKYLKALDSCTPDQLRHLASSYHDLLAHEKSLDFLVDLLQKDQIHDSAALNALDKTIHFYEHIYKSNFQQEKFSMSMYLRDLTDIVVFSNDSLQTDIQRIQILQKPVNDQSPFTALVRRLVEINEKLRAQAGKINRLVPQDDDSTRAIVLDLDTISGIEISIRNLDRVTKTFHEIFSGLSRQVLLLSDPNDRINVQEIENIAYQACDKIYKNEDAGPYDNLWNSLNETLSILTKISQSLETGSYDATTPLKSMNKQAIQQIADQLKNILNESDAMRGRLELKDEELIELKKLLKLKHDELGELNIRLSMNEKKIEGLQKELDEKSDKHKQALEEARVDAQKQIKQNKDLIVVLQKEKEQLEEEKSTLKEQLKQLTKDKLIGDLMQKRIGGSPKTSALLSPTVDGSVSPQRSSVSHSLHDTNAGTSVSEQEVSALRNTIHLLKDELWQLKMARSSAELAKLETPRSTVKNNEIADIYKSSTLLLNDLFSSIANYKITGENVTAKQDIVRSKMKLVDQTASDLNNRLNQLQSNVLPGSTVSTDMKTYFSPKFSKSFAENRQLAAEIHLPGSREGGELNVTQDQYRLIMREAIGCV